MRNRFLFASKANRDAAYRQHGGRRSSIRNQCLHPMYVEDLRGTPEAADTGIGNTVYKTLFGVLYILERD